MEENKEFTITARMLGQAVPENPDHKMFPAML